MAEATSTSRSERRIGTIIHWRRNGFGFLCEEGSRRKIYIHASRVIDDGLGPKQDDEYVDLAEGTRVEFTLVMEAQGPAAHDVRVLGDADATARR